MQFITRCVEVPRNTKIATRKWGNVKELYFLAFVYPFAPLYCSGEVRVSIGLKCCNTEEYRVVPRRDVQKLNAAKQKSKNLILKFRSY